MRKSAYKEHHLSLKPGMLVAILQYDDEGRPYPLRPLRISEIDDLRPGTVTGNVLLENGDVALSCVCLRIKES